jgi:MerR family redox-sensitive transcriptional activator SoxR
MEFLAIGEVAARSAMAPSALRYYEELGLIEATRAPGGARRFPRSVLRRLAVIRAGRNVGLSLPEIAAALDTLPPGRPPTAADWARLSEGWRDRLDAQIAALSQLRDGLSSCIGCGCLSVERCALSNPGDVAAGEGSGARWLHPALRRSTGVGEGQKASAATPVRH